MTESMGRNVVLTRDILRKMGTADASKQGVSPPRAGQRLGYSSERIDPTLAKARLNYGERRT